VNTIALRREQLTMWNMPMVRGGLTSANLKLVTDPKASPDLKKQQITLCKTGYRFLPDKSEITS
jgi:hypothetical protein